MRFHFQTLGCRLNEAERQAWIRQVDAAGHRVVDDAGEADLVVLNTCAVTGEAARKSRQQIRRARRRNPAAKVVVTGCYGTLSGNRVAAELGADRVIDNRDKDRLIALLTGSVGSPEALRGTLPADGLHRERAFVKIQDGCRYRCSYCIVTVARGAERSRPVDEVIADIEGWMTCGVQEVVLTGVHVGGYGSDLGGSLTDLVGAVLERTALPRLRLASLEPWAIPDRFLALFADRRLMPHLHLPLQSGSDRILRHMARRTRRAGFRRLVDRLRAAVPDLNLTTDVIAGFPGERDHDWRDTVGLVEELEFGDLHVFPFSPRSGTRAATLPDRVPVEIAKARCRELLAVRQRLRRRRLREQVGAVADVLVESAAPGALAGGYTPGYSRVAIDGAPSAQWCGTVRPVELLGLTEDQAALRGRVVTGERA